MTHLTDHIGTDINGAHGSIASPPNSFFSPAEYQPKPLHSEGEDPNSDSGYGRFDDDDDRR